MAGSFHIGRTWFHLQDKVTAALRTGGMFVNICPVNRSAAVEQSCITDEIGAGQIETIRTSGHAIVGSVRASGGIAKGVGSWRLEFVPTAATKGLHLLVFCTQRGSRQSACPLFGPTSRLFIHLYKS